MNERIRNIALGCSVEYIASPVWEFSEAELKKFGETIVLECVKRIQGCHLVEGYDPSVVGEYEMGYKKGIDKAASQVLLHFGLTL